MLVPAPLRMVRALLSLEQKATKGTKNSSSDSHCPNAMIEPASIFFRLPFVIFVSLCSNLPAAAADKSPKVPVTFPLPLG